MLLPVPLQDSSVQSSRVEYEKLLRESQKEVLRLQRQLSVTSSRQRPGLRPDGDGTDKCEENAKEAGQEKVKKKNDTQLIPRWPLLAMSTHSKCPVLIGHRFGLLSLANRADQNSRFCSAVGVEVVVGDGKCCSLRFSKTLFTLAWMPFFSVLCNGLSLDLILISHKP